jgi:hypothetical protein
MIRRFLHIYNKEFSGGSLQIRMKEAKNLRSPKIL